MKEGEWKRGKEKKGNNEGGKEEVKGMDRKRRVERMKDGKNIIGKKDRQDEGERKVKVKENQCLDFAIFIYSFVIQGRFEEFIQFLVDHQLHFKLNRIQPKSGTTENP